VIAQCMSAGGGGLQWRRMSDSSVRRIGGKADYSGEGWVIAQCRRELEEGWIKREEWVITQCRKFLKDRKDRTFNNKKYTVTTKRLM
jgi:hypothetical protein